jgi:hypothetical protein
MRYGHTLNTPIPESEDEAEFPPEKWAEEVTIRIRSADTSLSMNPIPVGGPLPRTWADVPICHARNIGQAAGDLEGYNSPNGDQVRDQSRPDPAAIEELA